jgi:hypothetical protein
MGVETCCLLISGYLMNASFRTDMVEINLFLPEDRSMDDFGTSQ